MIRGLLFPAARMIAQMVILAASLAIAGGVGYISHRLGLDSTYATYLALYVHLWLGGIIIGIARGALRH